MVKQLIIILGIICLAFPVYADQELDSNADNYIDDGLIPPGITRDAEAAVAYEAELDNSAGLLAALSDETGTGLAVFSTSPTLVTPILGTITSGVGTALTALNGENIQDDTIDDDSIDFADVTLLDFGLAATHDTSGELDALYEAELNNSAGLLAALSDETGTGIAVFSTSPTLVTPILGTITSGVGTTLTAINGENIQDDTIDDDSIDWADVTLADITLDADIDPDLLTGDTTDDNLVDQDILEGFGASATPKIVLDDSGGADGYWDVNATDADDAVATLGVDDSGGDDQTYVRLDGVDEAVEMVAPASAPTLADNGTYSIYLDEVGHNLKVLVKYSDGTSKTATVAFD